MNDFCLDQLSDFNDQDGTLVQWNANEVTSDSEYCFCVESVEGEHTIPVTAPTTARVLRELIRVKDRGITQGDVFGITKDLVAQIKELKKYGLKIKSYGAARRYGYDNRYVLEDKVTLKRKS